MDEQPRPDWYPDPEVPGGARYWDGAAWTGDRRAPAGGVAPAEVTQAPGAVAQIRARRTRERASNWHNAFIALFLLGLLGAAFIAYAASAVTTLDRSGFLATTSTSHDMGTALPVFIGAACAALLTSLPLLGFAHVLEAQADVLDLT